MSDVKDTIDIVKSKCQNLNYCSVGPDDKLYNNVCIGVNKYLEVKYTCV